MGAAGDLGVLPNPSWVVSRVGLFLDLAEIPNG
jgi:hypothetical protein